MAVVLMLEFNLTRCSNAYSAVIWREKMAALTDTHTHFFEAVTEFEFKMSHPI